MALPQHPAAALARRHFAFAAVFLAAAGLVLSTVGPALALTPALFAAIMIWAGLATRQSARAVLLANTAYERLSRGYVEEAEALLAEVAPRQAKKGSLARSIATQRAMIALYRGDAEKAAAEATRGIEAPYSLFGAPQQRTQDVVALALRALAHAASGRDADARADAERVETAELTTPEALARAGLARALMVSRTEGAVGLAALFAEGGAARMIEYLSPRERLLARALRRLARSHRPHAYRDAAKRDDADEPRDLASWVAKVAPAAAEYATEAHAVTAEVDTRIEPTPEARAQVARSRAKAARSGASIARKVFAVPLLLVIAFTALWQWLEPARHGTPVPVNEDVTPRYAAPWTLAPAVLLVFVVLLALQARRQGRIVRTLVQMRLDLARGEEARAEASLRKLTGSLYDAVAGNAWLGLSQIADRRADFEGCITACDAGLSRLTRTAAMRALQADIALPEIVSTRAFALAALGRREESDAERARLGVDYPSYPYAGRAHLRVSLAAALHAGDLEAAAKVARTRTADMPLALRDDLLVDVVLAVVDGASTEELERITAELRDDDKVRAWVDAVAPGLRDRIRGRARIAAEEHGRAELDAAEELEAPPALARTEVPA